MVVWTIIYFNKYFLSTLFIYFSFLNIINSDYDSITVNDSMDKRKSFQYELNLHPILLQENQVNYTSCSTNWAKRAIGSQKLKSNLLTCSLLFFDHFYLFLFLNKALSVIL